MVRNWCEEFLCSFKSVIGLLRAVVNGLRIKLNYLNLGCRNSLQSFYDFRMSWFFNLVCFSIWLPYLLGYVPNISFSSVRENWSEFCFLLSNMKCVEQKLGAENMKCVEQKLRAESICWAAMPYKFAIYPSIDFFLFWYSRDLRSHQNPQHRQSYVVNLWSWL